MTMMLSATVDLPRKTAEEIVHLYQARQQAQDPDLARMRLVRDAVNGDIALPLPELSVRDRPAVANLAQQGLQQLSRRVASIEPSLYFPPLRPDMKVHVEDAQKRNQIVNGWHARNKMKRRIGRRARYFLGYAAAPVLILPDRKLQHARWVVKDPLSTFPAEDVFDEHTPPDCIFVTWHTYGALLHKYGNVVRSVGKPAGWNFDDEAANFNVEFAVLQYVDAFEHTLILVGARRDSPNTREYLDGVSPETNHVRLDWARNLTDTCLAVVPGSINLSKQLGHFDGIIGMYQAQAALMALTIVAQRRTVWPREWVVSRPQESATVVQVPDPYEGVPGKIDGGTLETQNLDPSFSTLETMDRLEHAQRMTAALPAEFGGMSQSDNVRTGRRGQQVMGAAIDFTIAEAQDTFAESLVEENKRAIAIDKAYFGSDSPKQFFFPSRAFKGEVRYKPDELWVSDEHIVDYPIAGTDMQNLPVEGGQRVAMFTMSREQFMEVDPMIKDPAAERLKIQQEGIEQAFFTMVQALAAEPEGPFQPEHLARLYTKLPGKGNILEAFLELQREVQEEQATPTEDMAEQQPGIGTPGQGIEQPPAIPEGDPSLQNMSQLLGMLGTQQQAQRFRS